MFHVGALTPLAVNVYRGATSVVMRAFDPVRAWELIEREKISTGLMVPAMLNFMLQVGDFNERYDYSSLRWIMTGAAPVPSASPAPGAPTIKSSIPSPLTSPAEATALPAVAPVSVP